MEVIDEDHLLIKAAMGQGMLREVEANLRVATQKEYKESSRVINKEMYDQYKVGAWRVRGNQGVTVKGVQEVFII